VKKNAPKQFHPGEEASVCGMDKIITEDIAKKLHSKLGNWRYTIEFENGKDVLIAEEYLESRAYNLKYIKYIEAMGSYHYKMREINLGEIIEDHVAKEEKIGPRGISHYHRQNPNKTGKHNAYLDAQGNPLSKGNKNSRLEELDFLWQER
ncbi:MAG: hypothetical protein ACFFDT_26250, partial [Candidatus Hodarchaeota archaeon]